MPVLPSEWQHATTDEYTKLYINARITQAGGALTISQQALGDELGIQANSVGRLLHSMNLEIKANFDRFRVPTGMRGEQAVITASRQLAGRVHKLEEWINTPDKETFVRSYPAHDTMGASINKTLKEKPNAIIYIVVQQCNTYSFKPLETTDATAPIVTNVAPVKPAKASNIIEGDIIREKKARKKRFWISEIEDNEKVLYTSEFIARQALAYCYMEFDDKFRAISQYDGRVMFEAVDFAVVCYLFNHVDEFCNDTYNMVAPKYSYTRDNVGQVIAVAPVDPVAVKDNIIHLFDANGLDVAIPF